MGCRRMMLSYAEIIFLISLALLAFIPRKTQKKILLWTIIFFAVFSINFGIRIYLISSGHKKSEKLVELENEIDTLKHYTHMSFLDYKGLSTGGGAGGLRQATEISRLMEKVVQVNNGGYTIGTGATNEAIYKNVIELYPYFPFAYYFLAKSQKERNDAMWKSNAKKALEILTQTTKIDGHFLHHDQAKEDILTWEKSDQ